MDEPYWSNGQRLILCVLLSRVWVIMVSVYLINKMCDFVIAYMSQMDKKYCDVRGQWSIYIMSNLVNYVEIPVW